MTSSKEERLATIIDPGCLDEANIILPGGWKRSHVALTKASEIDAEYAEEIGRLRAGLEAAEKALQIIAWEGADSATSKQILAACRDTAREALALSTVVGKTE